MAFCAFSFEDNPLWCTLCLAYTRVESNTAPHVRKLFVPFLFMARIHCRHNDLRSDLFRHHDQRILGRTKNDAKKTQKNGFVLPVFFLNILFFLSLAEFLDWGVGKGYS